MIFKRKKYSRSYCKYFQLFKNKGIEFQFDWFTSVSDQWFTLKFETSGTFVKASPDTSCTE